VKGPEANAAPLGPAAVKLAYVIMAASAVAFAGGLLIDPARAWGGYLVGAYLALGLGVGGALLVCMFYLTGAGWGVVFRRIPEQMGILIPVGAISLAAILLGARQLYPWTRPEVLAESPLIAGKAAYLNLPFFAVRLVLFTAIWTWLARLLVRNAAAQDVDGEVAHTRANRRVAAIFAIVFGLTFTLTSTDWILSIQPEFYSTVFGIYGFFGLMLSTTAVVTLFAILLRRNGSLPWIRPDHLHDLGRLILTFSTLWAYAWLSQYLLIWYTNIPEEAAHYAIRTRGVWGVVWHASVLLNWVIPFILLLPRASKRSERTLIVASAIILVGQLMDVLQLVMPGLQSAPTIGWIELVVPLGIPALLIVLLSNRLGKAADLPRGDPLLQESLKHHL
jgi:Ni/Fe-hydrogenase subunit HybB-like protein